jgi:hypothetical protein
LNELSGFRSLFGVLERDIYRTTQQHPMAKVTSALGFRLFDVKWLNSKTMFFELSGVFNRLDRRVFYDATCGEVRFVYRLAYAVDQGGERMTGRLPTTLNVVFWVDGDDECKQAAQAWQSPAGLDPAAQLEWLLSSGALRPEARSHWRLKSVETNVQSVRLQSSVHPTLAGHIDYVMRVFEPTDASRTAFRPAPMENMPDVAAIERSPALKAELLSHLSRADVLAAIDRGTLQLPERFLAKVATSVSPRGSGRSANRPFRRLFTDADFNHLSLSRTKTIRSSVELLRRLDGASCVGCHQSHSIAGFHHVGEDLPTTPAFNALFRGSSPHLLSDLVRREVYGAAVAEGIQPDEFRPIPERQGLGNGHGAPCGLGDPGLADWQCAPGFSCLNLEDREVGACFELGSVGTPCEWGEMLPNNRPHKDYVTQVVRHACGEWQSCDLNVQGFPLGTCGSTCEAKLPNSTCGDFLDVDGYQACLRTSGTARECAEKFVFQTGLRECDAQTPCRQDAVCVRTKAPDVGACVPPYFVYQLRLDGLPI